MRARFLGFCTKFSNGVFLSTSFQTLAVLELTWFSVPGDLSISTVSLYFPLADEPQGIRLPETPSSFLSLASKCHFSYLG